MTINFERVLVEKKEFVWKEIEIYLQELTKFPSFCQIPSKYSSLLSFHQEIVSDYPKRKGKYLRPTLVLLTSSAMGISQENAIKTAAAMQISEDWILSHDDIEDDSLTRRGSPALHRIYGKELAINSGDSLHILMWKVLLDNLKLIGQEKGIKIIEEFNQMLNRTTLGQTIEIKWTKENKLDLTKEDVFFIMESKTGYYSIGGPMRLGAILAGANEKQKNSLYEFGLILGKCFQIKDDLLDLTSDFQGLKKQKGNDIFEGKRTLMLVHLLEKAEDKDKKIIKEILGKNRKDKNIEEVEWIINKMKEYQSLEHASKLAEKLAKQSLEYFDKNLGFLNKQPFRDQLKAGINFIVNRKY